MTRRNLLLSVGGLVTLAVAALGAILASPMTDRPDCPGKIVCPLTGELVCKDRCPLNAASAKEASAPAADELPACCQAKNERR